MAERFTEIHLPHTHFGTVEQGEISAEKMIEAARKYAAHLRDIATAVELAADEEFQIAYYRGVHVRRDQHEIQRSTRLAATPTTEDQSND